MNKATDLIAKLLANEDITVVQSNVETASFNIVDRVLTLPIWKDASEDLIGMLVGHEVGHALYTSTEYMNNEFSGTVYERPFQGYMNVIEDVRIEKLMKRKYPGIRKTFIEGYKELNNKDFFGMKSSDLNDMLLIDKINLYFKVGYGCGVTFNAQEKKFVERVEKTETIQDVIVLAKEIFDYTKDDLEKKMEEAEAQQMANGNEDASEDQEDGEESQGTTYGNGTQGLPELDELIEAKTDSSYQKRVSELADTKTKYVYFKPGKFKYDPFVSYKEVMQHADERMIIKQGIDYFKMTPQKLKKVTDLKTNSGPVVSYLIKEFEMKKAATAYKRTVISKTGQLDMRKIYAYTMKDDLFKRVSTVKTGKNHGMIFLLDWSGSMQNCIQQTLDQVINLAMFCRSAQIPFQVLAFSDNYRSESQTKLHRQGRPDTPIDELDVNSNTMALLEFFSSKMSSSEFNKMVTMIKAFGVGLFPLNGTPLNQALNYMTEHVGKFKKQNNVEKMTFITLTDGQGESLDGGSQITNGEDRRGITYKSFLLDDKTGMSYNIDRYNPETFTTAFLDIIKQRTGATTLGFYLTNTSWGNLSSVLSYHYVEPKDTSLTIDRMKKELKEKGYASLKGTGRDELFIVPLQAKIDDSALDKVNADSSASAIARQFGKTMNKRKTSRVLLSKFIDYIA